MTDRFTLGQQVRFAGTFLTGEDGPLSDPSTITLLIIQPDETELTYTYAAAQIIRDDVGLYHFDFVLSQVGYYHWRWEADGAVITAHEGSFRVPPSPFDDSIPMPPPPGGTGDDGKIARVQGGVYQPYAGVATGDVLQWNGSSWVSHTLSTSDLGSIASPRFLGRLTAGSGAVEQLTGTQATSMLIPFSSTLQGATPASGGGTTNYLRADGTWAAPVALPVSGGDDYKIAFGLTGNLAFASSVKLATTGDALRFGTTPASAGLLRAPANSSIVKARNNANTGDLGVLTTDASDNITVGDAASTAAVQLAAKSGGFHGLFVAGTLEYSFNATQLSWNANNSVGAGFYSTSGTVATNGLLRVASNQIIVSALNNAGTGNIQIIATDASDNVYVGGSNSQAATLNYNVKGGGSHNIQVSASTEYAFDSTKFDLKDNFAQFGTNPASTGLIRMPSSASSGLWARNAANSADIGVAYINTSDIVFLGDGVNTNSVSIISKPGTNVNLAPAGFTEYAFSSTVADFKDNVLQFGTNPAASGLVRTPNNTAIISARNAANTADVEALRVDGSNVVVIGGAGTPNAVRVYANATNNFTVAINGTDEYNLTATQLTMNNNNLVMGTGIISSGSNVASTGSVRGGYGLSIYSRNNLNSGDFNVIQSAQIFGVDNSVLVGDTTAAKVESWTGSGGSYVWRINGTVELQLDANKLFVANSGTPPTTDPSGGGYFYADSGAGKWRGSSGTVTTFGPAEPHCPRCDRDFALEWESKKYGKLSLCMSCVVDALITAGIPANDFVIERRVA